MILNCAVQGFAIGQRGPAFLDLQIITGTDVEQASYFFTAGSVGYLLGSVLAGTMYDKMNKSLLLLLSVFGLAVCTTVLPWCSLYGLMIAIHFGVSIFGGGIDTGIPGVLYFSFLLFFNFVLYVRAVHRGMVVCVCVCVCVFACVCVRAHAGQGSRTRASERVCV